MQTTAPSATPDTSTPNRDMTRRFALSALSVLGLSPLSGCGGGGDDTSASGTSGSTTTTTTTTTTDGTSNTIGTPSSCSVIPSETAGPYPGDGTNGVNALTMSGIVRSDIRGSFGGYSGTAQGVPLTVTLKLVSTSASCASLAGHAIYLWHCTQDGGYSLYSNGVTAQNFLRGVQVTDSNGEVTFTTAFPGCYSGRWPHMHFEVYSSLALATSGNNDVKTSQLAMPADACNQVYGAASGYSASVANFQAISLSSDNVFGNDSAVAQMATVTGNVNDGYVATLVVGI